MADFGKHCPSCSQISVIKLHEKLRFLSFTSLKDNQGTRTEIKMSVSLVCVCAQSYPTLYSCIDCRPPGSSVHGIFQARMLERVAILLQGIFLTYGSKQSLLHWQVDSLPLCHIGLNKFFIRLWKFLI